MAKIIVSRQGRMAILVGNFAKEINATAFFVPEKWPFEHLGKVYTHAGIQSEIVNGELKVELPPSSVAGNWSLKIPPTEIPEYVELTIPERGIVTLGQAMVKND